MFCNQEVLTNNSFPVSVKLKNIANLKLICYKYMLFSILAILKDLLALTTNLEQKAN